MNQQLEARKETKQSQVFNTEARGAGCGLDRVWIGLDPGLDRPGPGPRIKPNFFGVCCSLDAV